MEESKAVSNIHDEDVLRRMWQATEDFSRKKEIRAHMYRLREARLKEFYTSGEVLRDVQRSNSSPGLRDQPCAKDEGPTHADSLADHSFLSLKTKEVRDSESPTRDVHYRNSKNRDVDGQWTIHSNTTTSPDGKTITSSQRASTQGVRPLEGGQLSYAAANEHQASVFADGDDRNFTRSVGEASKTFAQEALVSGDDNNFRSSKTTTQSTSSRVVTESRSQTGAQLALTAGDDVDNTSYPSRDQKSDFEKVSTTKTRYTSGDRLEDLQKSGLEKVSTTKTRYTSGDQREDLQKSGFEKESTTKTSYTSGDLPEDLQKSISDGKTKVYTETKTLPDGSTVTTTRYETRGTKKFTDRSNGNFTTVTKTVREEARPTQQTKITKTIREVDDSNNRQLSTDTRNKNIDADNYTTMVTKTIRETEPTITSSSTQVTSSRQTVQQSTDNRRNIDDGNYKTVVTKTIREIEPTTSSSSTQVTSSRQTVQQSTDNRQNIGDGNYKTVVTKTIRETEPTISSSSTHVSSRQTVQQSTDNRRNNDDGTYITVATKTIQEVEPTIIAQVTSSRQTVQQSTDKRQNIDDANYITVATKTIRETEPVQQSTDNDNTVVTTTIVREVDDHRRPVKDTKTKESKPGKPSPQELVKSCKPQETYHPSSPTEGQYSTTYRSEFTNKRISVDVSATHDAFARSLRSISPDRIGDRPKSRASNSSLRSSTSPDKQPRLSPERKGSYDRRSPDSRHNTSPCRQFSPERKQYSPERKPSRPDSITVTKRRPSDKASPTSPTKTNVIKSPVSPTKESPKKKLPTSEDRKSPVRSPTKETNSDTITRKKKPLDDSPVKSPTKPEFNSDTITRKKKLPTDATIEITISSDTRKPTKTCTTEITVTTDTRNKKNPDRKSPTKTSTTEVNTDTITRKKKPQSAETTIDIDEQIITEVTEKTKHPPSRDLSSTSLASDIEFINHNSHIVTDLDEPEPSTRKPEQRPTNLDITETVVTTTETKSKPKSPTKGHPSSPVKQVPHPKKGKPTPELDSPDKPPTTFNIEDFEQFEQVCEVTPKEKPPLRRTETYEERCRQMLGLPEPDEIPKKDYDDMYAGMEPVEEPLFVKKNVTPLGPIGPDDYVIHDSVRKINKRREEIPEDVKPNIEEFIIKEQIEVVDAKPRDNTKSPQRKSPEKVTKKTSSPDRKSPRKVPDGQYNTEYTDEYCERPNEPTRVTTTKTIKITDGKPIRETSPTKDKKPNREISPKKDSPDYTTTKTSKVDKKPRGTSPKKDYPVSDKSTVTQKVTDKKPKETVTDKSPTVTKTPKVADKKPSREASPKKESTITRTTPETKSPRRPSKSSPTRPKQDMEFSTEYTDEYCEITGKKITTRPAGQKSEPRERDIGPVRGIPSKQSPEKSLKKAPKPRDDNTTDDEDIKPGSDRYSPSRTLPQNITVTEYINDYNIPSSRPDDFISREKHDTDITLATTPRSTKLQNIELNLETENVQETHVRTHRIDTKPREISPKRVPQKAVPSDTIECAIKKIDGPKKTPVGDRKSPAKQLKDKRDSTTKIVTTTTRTVTKKGSSNDIEVKKSPETPKKKSPETLKKTPSNKDLPKKPSGANLVRKPQEPPITVPKPCKNISVTSPNKTITQSSSVTIKTTKKKTMKSINNDTSDSEPEVTIVRKTNGVARLPDVSMPSFKRSTSSREPSAEKVCPVPVSDDEGSYPRYPDQVSEPEDQPFRRPVKITDIALTEEEDVQDFNRVTEVKPKRITDIDMVTETDESLLSVTEKVTKFITTSEKLTDNEPKTKSPAPKVPRPELIIDHHLANDECLLSVSDKVSKFITTAEQVQSLERPKSPRFNKPPVNLKDSKVNENDECLLSVNQKVSHFITAAETSKRAPSREGPAPKVARPEFKIDETLKTDECLLSVSDKVNKFLTSAEKLTTVTRQSPERRESTPSPAPRQKSPEKSPPTREPSPEKPPIKRTPDLVRKAPDFERQKASPNREPSPEKPHIKSTPDLVRKTPDLVRQKSPEKASPNREPSPEKPPIKRTPEAEPKNVNLKSSEAVKKAKAMFENISKTQEVPKQRDILSRPSVWEGRKKPVDKPEEEVKLTDIGVYTKDCKRADLKDVTLKSTKLILNEKQHTRYLSPEKDIPRSRSRSPAEIPGYMRPIPKVSPQERDQIIIETRYRETQSPDRELAKNSVVEEEIVVIEKRPVENGHLPHYMLPLQRNLSPEREPKKVVETIEVIEQPVAKEPVKELPGYMRPLQRHAHSPERDEKVEVDESRAEKKFGVTLRRTDSGRMVNVTSTERRRSSTTTVQTNIEEIEDLELLEKMMDKVVGYEQRRRIRSQIRVVKKLISDNKTLKTKKTASPAREITVSKPYEDRRYPIREPKRSPASPPKTTGTEKPPARQKSPERKSSSTYTTVTTTRTERTTKDRSVSPDSKKSSTSPMSYKPDLKRVQPPLKTSPLQEDRPSWVTSRNLKKTSETVEKRTVSTSKNVETARRSPSPVKDAKPTDCITSSYGIGPTDENGLPLFGIRALRKAADTKVQIKGTVVTSQFYSENGKEPVGEVTVTKYSNNPKELNIDDEQINKTKGIASVTTTQKFGSRGTPTFSSLVDKKKAITDKEEDEILKTTSTKVTRRGSVKALSQKFIENAVETNQKEKQNYPKAGLILRTSSFKETTNNDRNSSRESSPGYSPRPSKVSLDSITSTTHSTIQSSTDQSAKTFLNSHTKVANAQDVITRMKNAETERHEGDSAEDREARMLLNKFLGAQALMSGMEPLLSTQSTTVSSSTSSSSAHLVRKVQKKTVTSSSKESTRPQSLIKRYQTPITPEILEDIWDEQTLRALLEQCTDYEERRAIRARLRQVMAEQEAVANVVASAATSASPDRVQGESLLLPLLQELLDKKSSSMQRSASSQSSEESIAAATGDSGTESGEDLRLLAAAGLGSEPLAPGLLAEVQAALSKLALSLHADSEAMDAGRKNSLLQLVARLQASLVINKPAERRFAKQAKRQSRHTVGVSSEELAAARKLVQEVVLHDLPVKNSVPKPFSVSEPSTPQIIAPVFRQTSLNLETPLEHHLDPHLGPHSEPYLDPHLGSQLEPTWPQDLVSDDDSTVKQLDLDEFDTTPIHYITDVKTANRTISPVNADVSSAQRLLTLAMSDESKPVNRFNKKLKMKRANTIDIPKPLNFYECDDDSDDNLLDCNDAPSRRSAYLALRGPIRLTPTSKTVPSFEPKTENDKKFMAFISKHNNNQSNVSSVWANKEPAKRTEHNWSNKFGNIKTIFEKDEPNSRPPSASINTAKQFWQTADDAVNAGKRSYQGPKISKQGTRQLQSLFEQKQAENKLPWSTTEHNNIVTGTLKVESNFKPIQNNYKFMPQPLPVNKFDHAPMSAFKPPPKRTSFTPTPDPTTPLFLYTPKQPEFPSNEEPKPSSTPWISPGKNTEHRVLSIAAKKFENSSRDVSPQPRKIPKDKVYIPPGIQNSEKDLSAPGMVKNVPTKQTVRKLSGDYDNTVNYRPISNNTVPFKEPDRQIQTVKQNVQKFSKPDYSVSYKQPKKDYNSNDKLIHDQSTRRLSAEFPEKQSYQYEPNKTYTPIQKGYQHKQDQYPQEKQGFQLDGTKQGYQYKQDQYSQDKKGTKQGYQYKQEQYPQEKQDYQYRATNEDQYQYGQDKVVQENKYQKNQHDQYPLEKQGYQYKQDKYPQEKETYQSKYGQEKQGYQYGQDTIVQNKQQQEYQYNNDKSNHESEDQYNQNKYDQDKLSYQYGQDKKYSQDNKKQEYQYKQDKYPLEKEGYQYKPDTYIQDKQGYQYGQDKKYLQDNQKQEYKYPQEKEGYQYKQDKQGYQYKPDQYTQEKQGYQYKQEQYPSEKQGYQQDKQKQALEEKQDYQYPQETKKYSQDTQKYDTKHKDPPKPSTSPKQPYQDYYHDSQSYQYHPDAQKPTKPSLLFDFPSSESSASRSASTVATPDNLDEPEVVQSPLTEYKAVSKVMTGPVSQQAVTVTQNVPKKREEHDMAARNLTSMLKMSMDDKKSEKPKVSTESLEINDEERIETTKKTFSEGPVTTTQVSTTRVVQQSRQVSKPISPFAKFRQLDKQNSLNTPPSSPRTPTGTGAPMFKFTDPALSQSASTVKERLLHWAQMKTKEYQNIKLDNFSTSWADGMAFCALIHHFLPDAFDYHALNPKQRRHNFTLAFKVADSSNKFTSLLRHCRSGLKPYYSDVNTDATIPDKIVNVAIEIMSRIIKELKISEQADIAPLLDVDDMVAMRRPDWKCVFTYVQSIYRRFKDED